MIYVCFSVVRILSRPSTGECPRPLAGRPKGRASLRYVTLGFSLLVLIFGIWSQANAGALDHVGSFGSGQTPALEIRTILGNIEIELDERAAPEAVRWIERLVRGPVFDRELTEGNPFFKQFSYYDGLEFFRALRGTEVVTALRPPRHAIVTETRIDASALGLDRPFTDDGAEAMKAWQHTILPHYLNAGTEEEIHPRLVKWVQENAKSHTVDFLLKASVRQVNEVLGYRYVKGLLSRPVERGSVSLVPLNPRWSTPALHFSLRDRPDLTGKWMVVGHVVKGMDVIDQLSALRLTPAKTLSFRPLVPILISSSSFEWHAGSEDAQPFQGKE